MKTDIQIAQEAQMAHIRDVAATVGINEEELEFYGKYKAKLSDEVWERIKDRPDGKLVLVTAINPTPAGEGKRSCRRRIRAGCSHGGSESSFYRRFPCDHIGKQSACGYVR